MDSLTGIKLTPAMKQFVEIKKEYPDCIIMFRMGDFYEMFYDDAKTASRELEITLTSRGKGEGKALGEGMDGIVRGKAGPRLRDEMNIYG